MTHITHYTLGLPATLHLTASAQSHLNRPLVPLVDFLLLFLTKGVQVWRSVVLLLKATEFSSKVGELEKVSLHLHPLKLLTHLTVFTIHLYLV